MTSLEPMVSVPLPCSLMVPLRRTGVLLSVRPLVNARTALSVIDWAMSLPVTSSVSVPAIVSWLMLTVAVLAILTVLLPVLLIMALSTLVGTAPRSQAVGVFQSMVPPPDQL